ncbi:hypothetical protein KW800_00015 [Candidatus Parcubacteria bacterium]|nr:hypothetical protein [Candidatus Parcubacteria bacterium]
MITQMSKRKLILALTILPVFALAQTEATDAPATSTPIEIPVSESSSAPASTSSPQEGDTSQETLPSDMLENGANPQSDTSATTTVSAPEVAAPTATTTDIINVIEPDLEEVAEVPVEDLIPRKEYTFELTGESIAAKETPEWSQTPEEKAVERAEASTSPSSSVTAIPSIDSESAPNTLNVSGACDDPYFVVLLYKNEADYDQSPSSYIFNRAYPCLQGQYSYSISELPFNMQSGTFYLLIAGQGFKGPWKPISALIPVGITVTTIFPEASTSNESTP